MENAEKQMALRFKALGDENRIRVLRLLRNGECCACKLLEELNIRQPTLSHHMKILCDSGLVTGRREGKWIYYKIEEDGIRIVIDQLQAIYHENQGGVSRAE